MSSLRLAIAFLTIVPVRLRGAAPSLGAAAPWFPLVGAAIGALAGVAGWAVRPSLGATVAAVLAIVVAVIVTGGLHQDGLADCGDALGVRWGDRDRRLQVMRDSAIGTFGALAVGLWLLLVVASLAGLNRDAGLTGLVVAAAVGRWAALVHAVGVPPARADGLGASFAVRPVALAVATLIAAAAAIGLERIDGLIALGAGGLAALAMIAWARRFLGGRTGDTLGATVALAEAAVLVALLASA